ncbi:hypothetical protein [Paenibacillus sp. An7]|uniref:hypothetical protein n=1 Tax=Paenibacillus sp. An7 TaxID=2689577 RepID=UPI001358AD62|nr:hypothetical protein [Paenibacillus sp. An7]
MNKSISSNINHEQAFLFNVDIMIHSRTNALALQALLEILNEPEGISDFRIQSGIELGTRIKEALHEYPSADPRAVSMADKPQSYAATQPYSTPASTCPSDEWINSAMQAGRLIRIHISDNKGQQKSIPCRILNYDQGTKLVSIYHVDEKQVYSIHTSEIEKYV